MEKKYSLEKKMTRGEWGNLITFFISGLFVVGLLYLLEYTVNVGMTFQLDRDEKHLSKINEDVDNLRIKNIGLSQYNRIASEGSRLQAGNISFAEADLKPKKQNLTTTDTSTDSKSKSLKNQTSKTLAIKSNNNLSAVKVKTLSKGVKAKN